MVEAAPMTTNGAPERNAYPAYREGGKPPIRISQLDMNEA
jgi:hypothetical protein